MAAIIELMGFKRHAHENIDALLTRFITVRHRAAQQGAGMVMNIEGYSWLLLKAVGVTPQQLIQLLQRTAMRFPTTEAEFDALQVNLRRIGHVLEHSHLNIASSMRGPQAHAYPLFGSDANGTQ